MFTEKSNFLRGKGVHDLKVGGSGGGGRGLGQFSHLRGKGSGKKRGCFLSLILKDRVHAMTLANQLTHKHIQIFQKITA